MHAKTIKYLIKRGTCICGTHLSEGSIPYNKVMELLDYLPPQSIGVTVGQFIKDSRSQYGKEITLYNDVANQLALIRQQDETIAGIENEISLISEKLDGDDVREQVKKLNAQIQACERNISDRTAEQKRLLNRQGAAEKEKSLKETSRSELSCLMSIIVELNSIRPMPQEYILNCFRNIRLVKKASVINLKRLSMKSSSRFTMAVYL